MSAAVRPLQKRPVGLPSPKSMPLGRRLALASDKVKKLLLPVSTNESPRMKLAAASPLLMKTTIIIIRRRRMLGKLWWWACDESSRCRDRAAGSWRPSIDLGGGVAMINSDRWSISLYVCMCTLSTDRSISTTRMDSSLRRSTAATTAGHSFWRMNECLKLCQLLQDTHCRSRHSLYIRMSSLEWDIAETLFVAWDTNSWWTF